MEMVSTNSVVQNDIIIFDKSFFTGSIKKPKFSHRATIKALVLSESYGVKKQQHTFRLRVIECSSNDYKKGDEIHIKGRNIYRYGVKRELWEDENARSFIEETKFHRGKFARKERTTRKAKKTEILLEDRSDSELTSEELTEKYNLPF